MLRRSNSPTQNRHRSRRHHSSPYNRSNPHQPTPRQPFQSVLQQEEQNSNNNSSAPLIGAASFPVSSPTMHERMKDHNEPLEWSTMSSPSSPSRRLRNQPVKGLLRRPPTEHGIATQETAASSSQMSHFNCSITSDDLDASQDQSQLSATQATASPTVSNTFPPSLNCEDHTTTMMENLTTHQQHRDKQRKAHVGFAPPTITAESLNSNENHCCVNEDVTMMEEETGSGATTDVAYGCFSDHASCNKDSIAPQASATHCECSHVDCGHDAESVATAINRPLRSSEGVQHDHSGYQPQSLNRSLSMGLATGRNRKPRIARGSFNSHHDDDMEDGDDNDDHEESQVATVVNDAIVFRRRPDAYHHSHSSMAHHQSSTVIAHSSQTHNQNIDDHMLCINNDDGDESGGLHYDQLHALRSEQQELPLDNNNQAITTTTASGPIEQQQQQQQQQQNQSSQQQHSRSDALYEEDNDTALASAEEFLESFVQTLQPEDMPRFFANQSFRQFLNVRRLQRRLRQQSSGDRVMTSSSYGDGGSEGVVPEPSHSTAPIARNIGSRVLGVEAIQHHNSSHQHHGVYGPARRNGGGNDGSASIPLNPSSSRNDNGQTSAAHDLNSNRSIRSQAVLEREAYDRLYALVQLRAEALEHLDLERSSMSGATTEQAVAAGVAPSLLHRHHHHGTINMEGSNNRPNNGITAIEAMENDNASGRLLHGTAHHHAPPLVVLVGDQAEHATPDLTLMLKSLKVDDKILAKIDHSAKFTDDVYEYRFVILPRQHPYFELDLDEELRERLLKDTEWRALGIRQTRGWEHHGYSRHESNVFLFRRALGTHPGTGKVSRTHQSRVEERKKLLEVLKRDFDLSRRSLAQFSEGPTTFAQRRHHRRSVAESSREGAVANTASAIDVVASPMPVSPTSSITVPLAAIPLITTVPSFGSLQAPSGGGGASMMGSPSFGFIDHSTLLNATTQMMGNNNNLAGACRRIANSINARHLTAVIRTGDVLPQPPGPFFDLPFTEDDDQDDQEQQDDEVEFHNHQQKQMNTMEDDTETVDDGLNEEDIHQLNSSTAMRPTTAMTKECFINDIDWLYASLHMPLFAS